ncbi:DUF1559 domain-containing protein [Bremerella alba]|uniref:DUF1559 domain-containing protein n=1 Tax=Bremerella alba TaxID=980252 RepID=A0A7V9A6I4_9BACT|nr:DUF1559 domain-containing protein [Bremerella alba]MBA2114410.1 hypothetical protein [Bremerella alba]
MSRSSCRSAFTLVELLVVIAIIGILIALLLPAVQMARESARRTECVNHLKQLGLAFHNHHDILQKFPHGGINAPDGDPCCQGEHSERTQWSWPYQILPYIEQNNLYDNTNHNQVYQTAVELYYCPSRRSAQGYGGSSHARIDYAANAGTDNEGDNGVTRRQDRARTGFQDIVDGTSNTMMVGEKQTDRTYDSGCCDDNENPYNPGWEVDIYRRGNSPPDHDRNHPETVLGTDSNSNLFGAAHPSGINTVLVDGSVRFVSYTVDGEMFRRLCVIDDGLVVSHDSL